MSVAPSKRTHPRNPRGYLLMEAMVGGAVLAIALVGMATLTTGVTKATAKAAARSDAASLVTQRMEQTVGLEYNNLNASIFPASEDVSLNGRIFTRTTTTVAGTEPNTAVSNFTVNVTVTYTVSGDTGMESASVIVVEAS